MNKTKDKSELNISSESIKTNIYTGLSTKEVLKQKEKYGLNELEPKKKKNKFLLFLDQFKDPLLIMLIIAVLISIILNDITNSVIILIIVFISSILSFIQEYKADDTMKKLLEMVKVKTIVLRNGKKQKIDISDLVPNDIVSLTTGNIIPADGIIINSESLLVDESSLTGESIPISKKNDDKIFMGTYVYSGKATIQITNIGTNTEFGKIGKSISNKTKTEFEKTLEDFSKMLMHISIIIVLIILVLNLITKKTAIDSIMFALSIAIGMAPQLLPAINTITLSYGAKKLSEKKVIVKKLNSIQNLGSMNILCTDKTGTITEGKLKVDNIIDINGKTIKDGLKIAYINSKLQTGFKNPIDEAINIKAEQTNIINDFKDVKKIAEAPYNFDSKLLTIAASLNSEIFNCNNILITKGSVQEVLNKCKYININNEIKNIDAYKEKINKNFKIYSFDGYRVIGLSYKNFKNIELLNKNIGTPNEMIFLGFILIHDPLKKDSKETIKNIMNRGIDLKIITGDNKYIAKHIARELELDNDLVITGNELDKMTNTSIAKKAKKLHIFAEINPRQKERIIDSLKENGNIVGYLGDGINDAPALKRADVSISVSEASDIAKEVADLVLMEPELTVLENGIIEGRKIFVNTMKYIFMTAGENFGNMFSMSFASVALPFIPLLPDQLMITNLITDIPQTQIASDNIDENLIKHPQKYDVNYIKKFMKYFGLSSAAFDILIFFLIYYILKLPAEIFRTIWFIESCLAELLSIFVLRTQKPFYKTKPSKTLDITILLSVIATIIIPYTKLGNLLELQQLPLHLFLISLGFAISDAISKEFVKKIFYKKKQIEDVITKNNIKRGKVNLKLKK